MHSAKSSLTALTLGALGVVYGDIGTSVLYALKEVFNSGHISLTPEHVYGVLSLVVWTVTVIVSLKYVTLVLRADNRGEGGLVAMLALAAQAVEGHPRLRKVLMAIGIFGTCLFYGDGVITPAISVLSAVEGLAVLSPRFESSVVPLTLAILLALFAVQKRGTAGIGRWFGPIMLVWFLSLAGLGIWHIAHHPTILWALSPHYALQFIWDEPGIAFLLLGAVVLCVTGAEALYADLGHFGKRPIRHAWFGVAMPALLLNYLGQGALLLQQPEAVSNPFFAMAPRALLLPLVVLATAATVIASQALITGAFSVTKQVIQLGYLPRLQVLHTSETDTGQIYMPLVNWGLCVGIALAVIFFQSSGALAAAYGIAVTLDMLITTILTFFVVRWGWRYPLLPVAAATLFFLVVDVSFFASNLIKLPDGGWFPLAIGGAMFVLMRTWHTGRQLITAAMEHHALPLASFLDMLRHDSNVTRVAGTAVFLSSQAGTVPSALLHNLKHNKVLHARNLFVTVRHHEVAHIPVSQRFNATDLGHECRQVILHFGFKDEPHVPAALYLLASRQTIPSLSDMETSYFLSRDIIVAQRGHGMVLWREKLFAQMYRNAGSAADFLHLPHRSVVELGSQIVI
ncbi:potassium transporter Kup [Comamonas aquatica]|uniref:potassium transporter Kup n=1 Tax=Comamonas aquatica TaxID=225991 RepID=UPI0021B092AE|nr:potassium transporter Kup [Comamonas aquatica]